MPKSEAQVWKENNERKTYVSALWLVEKGYSCSKTFGESSNRYILVCADKTEIRYICTFDVASGDLGDKRIGLFPDYNYEGNAELANSFCYLVNISILDELARITL